jgi:hypothetical protein
MRKFLLSILLILWPLSGGGQICPDGTWPLPWGVTRDGETAELRQIVCQDKNGKISFQPQRVDNIRIADQYASIQAAIDSLPVGGGVVFIPAGTYITGTIVLPVLPKVVNLFGAGVASTILQANAANIPVIKGGATPTESRGNSLSGFSVKAHASGSTGPAIEMAGFRSATFGDIGYLSNGAGNFNSLFHFASHIDGAGSHCYGNLVRHLVVDSQTGPTTVLLFDNDGTADPNYQANQNEIQDIWVNANTGITTVVDARRSAQTKISGGVIEGNAGAVVLIPGTLTTF